MTERAGRLRARFATLRAIVDTIIPPDEWKGGWDGGVESLLLERLDGPLDAAIDPLLRLCEILDRKAASRFGAGFAGLDPERRGALFEEVAADPEAKQGVDAAINASDQGFYAAPPSPEGWAMLGFDPGETRSEIGAELRGIPPAQLAAHYDVIVIGAGAGGGVAAAELAAQGRHVLLIDRSRPMTTAELRNDHLRGKRLQLHEVVAGAGAGSPRVRVDPDGSTRLLPGDGDGGEYGLVAMTLGGGTRLWQGMAWRFYPEDFRMATTYGVPPSSTLADWPFGYDELAPYYDRVETELGVSGDATGPAASRTPRTSGYPMPPFPADAVRGALDRGARSLGWTTMPIPLALNSVARDGRPACIRCAQCIGHACPVDAKNGTHNTFIPRALASGACDLLLSAQAVRIEPRPPGAGSAVHLRIDTPVGPMERIVVGQRIVLAAGAVESPRLLLASGLGNDWVGRNHHSHGIAGATALAGAARSSYRGPGNSVATVEWVHHARQAWGGGVMFDEAPMYPLAQARFGRRLPGLRWGSAHKEWMRAGTLLGTRSMVQEVPDVSGRITLDPTVVDRWGMPVARLAGRANEATRAAVEFMADRCAEWLEASGGRDLVPLRIENAPQGAEHSAGTIRLAADPARGACDPQGRLFGARDIFVADASLHPTNGGFNPALTVMANAMRVARLMS